MCFPPLLFHTTFFPTILIAFSFESTPSISSKKWFILCGCLAFLKLNMCASIMDQYCVYHLKAFLRPSDSYSMNYIFNAKVKPNSPEFTISKFSETVVICTENQPENNKANLEIVKELSRIFGKNVRILRGLKSKNKTIMIEGITEKDFEIKVSKP